MNVERLVRCSRDLLGLEISPDMQRAFSLYADELLAWTRERKVPAGVAGG